MRRRIHGKEERGGGGGGVTPGVKRVFKRSGEGEP